MKSHEFYMHRAIKLARQGMLAGDGGPFGCVIVRDGEIIGEGWNRVVADNDPTAHGEVTAIRDACAHLSHFSLDGAVLYTTGKPCPMCQGAILWSRIKSVYYGFDGSDAATIGFDDAEFYREMALPEEKRQTRSLELLRNECLELVKEYAALEKRTAY